MEESQSDSPAHTSNGSRKCSLAKSTFLFLAKDSDHSFHKSDCRDVSDGLLPGFLNLLRVRSERARWLSLYTRQRQSDCRLRAHCFYRGLYSGVDPSSGRQRPSRLPGKTRLSARFWPPSGQ